MRELAIKTLGRFTRLANEMRVENFVLVATAAVREAERWKYVCQRGQSKSLAIL